MSASEASIMKSPTRLRSSGAARGVSAAAGGAGRGGGGGLDGIAASMSRRRRSVTRNPSSGGCAIGRA